MRLSKLRISIIVFLLVAILFLFMVYPESNDTHDDSVDTQTPNPLLPQTISSEDGLMTIAYPAGWLAEMGVNNTISLYNSEEAKTTEEMHAGLLAADIRYVLPDDISGMSLSDNPTARELLKVFIEGAPPQFTEIRDIGGTNAAIALGTTMMDDQMADVVTTVAIDSDDAYGVMTFFISPDEADGYIEIIEAIVASFDYMPSPIGE